MDLQSLFQAMREMSPIKNTTTDAYGKELCEGNMEGAHWGRAFRAITVTDQL